MKLAIAAVSALAVVLVAGVAYAADTTTLTIPSGPVAATDCTACHANMTDSKRPSIIFKHGMHTVYACVQCHEVHPLPYSGTVLPDMKACWNCHGLDHGPQGEMASSKCADCHKVTKGLRPKSHVKTWAATPHVKPGEDQLSTLCMMCHTQKFCEDCHIAKEIIWVPKKGRYVYDAENGCLACHGGPLPRLPRPVDVAGSAHREIPCGKCHPDFKYEDGPNATKLWTVNAGLGCQKCHVSMKGKDATIGVTVVQQFLVSDHGKALARGDYKAPTCAKCHGGHDIERADTARSRYRLHVSGQSFCGGSGCHQSFVDSYNDWWHGKAYKRGAPDAPSCWSCHGAHDVREAKDPKSAVSEKNTAKTCGQQGCHEGASESFVLAAGGMIHGYNEVRGGNWLRETLPWLLGK